VRATRCLPHARCSSPQPHYPVCNPGDIIILKRHGRARVVSPDESKLWEMAFGPGVEWPLQDRVPGWTGAVDVCVYLPLQHWLCIQVDGITQGGREAEYVVVVVAHVSAACVERCRKGKGVGRLLGALCTPRPRKFRGCTELPLGDHNNFAWCMHMMSKWPWLEGEMEKCCAGAGPPRLHNPSKLSSSIGPRHAGKKNTDGNRACTHLHHSCIVGPIYHVCGPSNPGLSLILFERFKFSPLPQLLRA